MKLLFFKFDSLILNGKKKNCTSSCPSVTSVVFVNEMLIDVLFWLDCKSEVTASQSFVHDGLTDAVKASVQAGECRRCEYCKLFHTNVSRTFLYTELFPQ